MKIFLFILFLFPWVVSGQNHFFSDCFKGGVTGGGYNPTFLVNTGFIKLHIPLNAIIKKATLFATANKLESQTFFSPSIIMLVNDSLVTVSLNQNLENEYNYGNVLVNNITVYKDITKILNINSIQSLSGIHIKPYHNGEIPYYTEFYVLIIYEDINLQKTCLDVFINTQNAIAEMDYLLYPSFVIDYNRDVALILNTANICDTVYDGSYVYINSQYAGLIGGNESNFPSNCSSPSGNFYYQNNNLVGLTDDNSNSLFLGTDAIANINNFGINNPINLRFNHQSSTSPAATSNNINQLFLTYTTPCDVFLVSVPSDTTACLGTPLQLNVVGGQRYEWQPATSLSCSDCPNPIFTGTSSTLYSVRIWNNDSCSVVRPVRVTVASPPPKTSFTAVDTKCSTPNSGSIRIVETPEMSHFYAVNENGVTFINNGTSINNLPTGTYTVYYTNASGCKSPNTVLTIGYQKEAIANFTVLPTSGAAPLTVQITNTSLNATDYQWSLNGETITSLPTIFDTAGHYQLQLIAWNTNPNCADTITKTVFVYDSLIVQLPNVITPNNDGVNDLFTLSTNLPLHAKIYIYNRWGNEVHLFDQQLNSGTHTIWDGKTNATQTVSDGVYFYKATFTLSSAVADCAKQNCTTELSGFVTLISGN